MSRKLQYIAVTMGDVEKDAEAYGPFSTRRIAEGFAERYNAAGVRPAYPLMVVELYGVRAGWRTIMEEEAAWSDEDGF